MPNANRSQTFYNPTGNPATANTSTLYFPGQLGQAFDVDDRAFQTVQTDSGATSATPTGAIAVGQLLMWKDRSKYLVTNDPRFALLDGQANSFRNNTAGVAMVAATAGNYINVLQRGRAISVLEAGSATGGMLLVHSTTGGTALGVAINTAAPAQNLGVVRTATANGACVADLDIPNIP